MKAMTREEQLLQRRLADLCRQAADNYYCTFSDFLNMNEQTLFYQYRDNFLSSDFELYGGYPDAERRMIQFCPHGFEKDIFPIACVCIRPVNLKFADKLTHRDFLGALLHMGIDRSKLGDILVDGLTAYVFAVPSIADYISGLLTKVKHTKVEAFLCDIPEAAITPHFKTKQSTVTSIRLDSIIAAAFNLSRALAVKYISSQSVFINGRLTESASAVPKDYDIISVRGLGRFKFENTSLKSKKDKFVVKTHIYI